MRDVPAGDFDYERDSTQYATIRKPDPRIALVVRDALGNAETLINVGAGAGSYEPLDMAVTAVEPSASMRAQRPAHLAPAFDAVAEDLPFPDKAFDAALASITVHQWGDLSRGLAEMRRVTRGPVVIMTFDPVSLRTFWLSEYAPEMMERESGRMPAIDDLATQMMGRVRIDKIPIPADCEDGFAEAFFGRPEAFLDPQVRKAQSAWGFIDRDQETQSVARLRGALDDGTWDDRFGSLRTMSQYDGSLRLVVSRPSD